MTYLESLFLALVDLSWRGLFLLLPVLFLRAWLSGRVPARILFWVWIVVALRFLLPVSFQSSWTPLRLPAAATMGRSLVLESSPALFPQEGNRVVPVPSTTGPVQKKEQLKDLGPSAKAMPPAKTLLSAFWLGGVLLLVVRRTLLHWRFSRSLRSALPATAGEREAIRASLGSSVELGHLRVFVSASVSSPCLQGLLHPKLLLPRCFFEDFSEEERRHILLHELAHARRGDLWVHAGFQVVTILHWFNPLVWIAARLARRDCELACDDSVLKRLTHEERAAYGSTLLKAIKIAMSGSPVPGGLGMVDSKQEIKKRLVMIIKQPTSSRPLTALGFLLLVGVTGLSFTRAHAADSVPVSESKPAPARVSTIPPASIDDPALTKLDALFPSGTILSLGEDVITVLDVKRELAPLLPIVKRENSQPEVFQAKVQKLQNEVIANLVNRILLVREFRHHSESEAAKVVSPEQIDKAVAEIQRDQFGGDPAKQADYLKSRGMTPEQFRKGVEEDIIYSYMRAQERKLMPKQPKVPVGPQVHLRMIQLNRAAGESDASLAEKAKGIVARLDKGESFESLAREFDQSSRRDKGGDWGWQAAADLKPIVAEKVFALGKGSTTSVFLPEGCFIVHAEDRR